MKKIIDFGEYNNTNSDFNLSGKIKLKVMVFLALFVGLLFFSQLVFANNLATDGQKLSEVESEIKKLERENVDLVTKIASESSLSTLSKKAQKSGFIRPANVIVF